MKKYIIVVVITLLLLLSYLVVLYFLGTDNQMFSQEDLEPSVDVNTATAEEIISAIYEELPDDVSGTLVTGTMQ